MVCCYFCWSEGEIRSEVKTAWAALVWFKHAAMLMDSNLLSRPLCEELRGRRMWEAFRPLLSFQSVNFALLFPSSLSPHLPIFFHLRSTHACYHWAGSGWEATEEFSSPAPLQSNPPPLHLYFHCQRSTAVLHSHDCHHDTIITTWHPVH